MSYWSIKPELTGSYARQSAVFPPSGDRQLRISAWTDYVPVMRLRAILGQLLSHGCWSAKFRLDPFVFTFYEDQMRLDRNIGKLLLYT